MKHTIGLGLCLAASISLVACSNGMESSPTATLQSSQNNTGKDSGQVAGTLGDEQLIELEKMVDGANQSAEDSIAEAEAAIESIMDENGNIKMQSQSSDKVQAQLFISSKIADALDKVKLALDKVPEAFKLARTKLADAIAKLDANNPSHQVLIAKSMKLMEQIDKMEAHVNSLKKVLRQKINLVIQKLDVVIRRLQSNILGAVLSIELSDIRQVLVQFRNSIR